MGRPFRSVLAPIHEDIVSKRKEGQTWEEITRWVKKKLRRSISRQAIQDYFKRHRKKLRVPMGMEVTLPDDTTTTAPLSTARQKHLTKKEASTPIFDDTRTN